MRILPQHARESAAYLLVEYLIYIALLAVIMEIAFGAFYRSLGGSRDLHRNSKQILQALQAGETWRADLRQAVSTPAIITDEQFTAFEIPTAGGRVVYLFDHKAVWRQLGETPPRQLVGAVKASFFAQDQRQHVTAWTWEVELATKKKVVHLRPLFTFRAVVPLPRS
jgi:hypothetical protein